MAATGADGRARIAAGGGGAASSQINSFVDQAYLLDMWAFEATTGCWELEGEAPNLAWGFAYDSASDVFVGYDWFLLDTEVWLPNLANPVSEIWTKHGDGDWQRELLPAMLARNGPAMAYHPGADRVVLFSGCALLVAVCLDDTWTLDVDAGTWMRMSPATSPAGRSFHSMEYVPGLDRIVLFGGHVTGPGGVLSRSDETWLYDVAADEWTRLEVAESPSARAYPQLAYAESVGLLYLSGGHPVHTDDLWYLDVEKGTWVAVDAPDAPMPRSQHAMAYDAASGLLVVFGGDTGGGIYNDETWLFDPVQAVWHSPDLR